MEYTELTAKQLQELCRERGVDTARDKATMIARLTEDDVAKETKESYEDAPAPLPDGVLPASETETVSPDPEPAPEPPEATFWIVDGTFNMRYQRHGMLDEDEHLRNQIDVATSSVTAGFLPYGPAFRVSDPDSKTWVYRINVRN